MLQQIDAPTRTRWRCEACTKFLGWLEGGLLTIDHGHVFIRASLPVERNCERCGHLNRLERAG